MELHAVLFAAIDFISFTSRLLSATAISNLSFNDDLLQAKIKNIPGFGNQNPLRTVPKQHSLIQKKKNTTFSLQD